MFIRHWWRLNLNQSLVNISSIHKNGIITGQGLMSVSLFQIYCQVTKNQLMHMSAIDLCFLADWSVYLHCIYLRCLNSDKPELWRLKDGCFHLYFFIHIFLTSRTLLSSHLWILCHCRQTPCSSLRKANSSLLRPFCAIAQSISSMLGCGAVLPLDVNLYGQHSLLALRLRDDANLKLFSCRINSPLTGMKKKKWMGKKTDERKNKHGSLMFYCCLSIYVLSYFIIYFICGCFVNMGHKMSCTNFVDTYWSLIKGWQ